MQKAPHLTQWMPQWLRGTLKVPAGLLEAGLLDVAAEVATLAAVCSRSALPGSLHSREGASDERSTPTKQAADTQVVQEQVGREGYTINFTV